MKKNMEKPGKTGSYTGVHEPVAEYLPETGPVIVVDATGRMVLPKKIREQFKTRRFVVLEKQGHIELVPVKPLDSLFGIFPEINMEKMYREHDRDVEEEDRR